LKANPNMLLMVEYPDVLQEDRSFLTIRPIWEAE